MKNNMKLFFIGLLGITLLISGCGGGSGGVSVSIDPEEVTLVIGQTQQFNATVSGSSERKVTWSVDPKDSGGTINSEGLYTAPLIPGKYYVIATSVADSSKSAKATVNVTVGGPGLRKYTGTITISKSGVTSDGRDHYDESAELTELAIMEGAAGWWGSLTGLYVDAYLNDSIGDPPQCKVTFGPQKYQATKTIVMLFIDESTDLYTLVINCIVENATFTDPEAGSIPYDWPIAIYPIENIPLPADPSRLTGTDNQNIDGVPATITWDLTRNI